MLSSAGGVYEGEWTMANDRTLRADLRGYQRDRVVAIDAQLELGADAFHLRLGCGVGAERSVLLDAQHERITAK